MLKAVGILTLMVLASMFVCPVLAAVAPQRTVHSCGDQPQQQKQSQQQMKGCCEQQAVSAKETRFPHDSYLVGSSALMPASVSRHDDPHSSQASPAFRHIKSSERLAALSTLRI